MAKPISIRNTILGNVSMSQFLEASVEALGHFHWRRPSELQASLYDFLTMPKSPKSLTVTASPCCLSRFAGLTDPKT